jgi:hypothetical protein
MLYNPFPVTILDPACPVFLQDLSCILATRDLEITFSIARIAERMWSNPFFENEPNEVLNGTVTNEEKHISYHEPGKGFSTLGAKERRNDSHLS